MTAKETQSKMENHLETVLAVDLSDLKYAVRWLNR